MASQTTPPIAIDTNVLVYAHRDEMDKHDAASALVQRLVAGDTPWGIPVFCVGEFLRVVTHRGSYPSPTPLDEALKVIDSLLQSPSVQLLQPSGRYWSIFNQVATQANVSGNLVFDAQIAAVCLENGFRAIVSDDRDIRRFEGIEAVPIT